MRRNRLGAGLTACAGIIICAAVVMTGPEPLEASQTESKPVVSTRPLERSVAPNTVVAFGALTPPQTLLLTTQVPGQIVWVNPQLIPGGTVEAGDLLFRIDNRDYAIAVANAQASHAQAEANIELEKGRAEIARLEWATWQKENGEALPASPLALRAPQQADAIARRKAIRTQLDQARLALERTEVHAPWSATVVQANTVPGQVLAAGAVTATLFPVDFGVVEVQVPAAALQLIDAGIDNISLRPMNDPAAAPVAASIEGIVRNLTADTRLATIRVRVEAPLEHDGWAYGMHLQASFVTREPRAIAVIPSELIVGGNLMWVYRNGRALQRQIQPVEYLGTHIRVEDDFDAGDALIIERPIGLFDGAEVDVTATGESS